MYQNLFPVKTVSLENFPVFWENREMFLPFISASNVASYFVAEVFYSGIREKRNFPS